MKTPSYALLAVAAAALLGSAVPAGAAELLAPLVECSLEPGKVIVLGRAPGAERGTAEWGGGSTSFRVRDGRFTVALNLDRGVQEVVFRIGDETLEARWAVGQEGGAPRYAYHPKTGEGECAACHDPAAPPGGGEDVSEICSACHGAYGQRAHVHGPVAMGLCTACHDPHGGAEPAFLRTPRGELCTYCHNQPVTASHQREAGATPCTACHDPHGTDLPYHVKPG